MRLFVAVTPPQAALAALAAAAAALRADWPGLRWAGLDKWHVTRAFLGEVADERLADLQTRLARASGRHHALRLRIGRGGAFPSPAKARGLCAHIHRDPQPMSDLPRLTESGPAAARPPRAPPPAPGRRYPPPLTPPTSHNPPPHPPL